MAAPAPARNGTPKTVKQLREDRDRLRYEAEIAQLSRRRDAYGAHPPNPFSQPPAVRRELREEWAGTWVDAYLDMVGEFAGGSLFAGGHGTPISTTIDRRTGQDFPIFVNEVQLGAYRAPARILCSSNGYAIGLMNGLCNYVAGTGFTYTVVPKGGQKEDAALVADCQAVLDEFQARELWWELERELIWRTHEDGEYFLRHGQHDGDAWARTVEPEQIVFDERMFVPAGVGPNPQAGTFGVLTDAEDTQTVKGYCKRALIDADIEYLPAADVVHHKINTKRSIKRGLTDFCFSTYDALQIANKLRRNLGEGAAVQAALAGVIEHETATTAQVNDYIAAAAAPNQPIGRDGKPRQDMELKPGDFAHMDAGSKFVPPPGSDSGQAHVLILSACLRQVTARYNAPDWLASSDSSSTNFAAALTAESPWVMSILRHQKVYKERFGRTMRKVLVFARDRGRLPRNVLELVEISVEAPSAMARNTLQEAQENQIYVQMGVKSVQQVSKEQDLDYEEEQDNIEAHRERTGGAGVGLSLPDDDEPGDGGKPPAKPGVNPAGPGSAPPKPASTPPGSAQESRDRTPPADAARLVESLEARLGPAAAAVYRAAADLLEGAA